LLGPVGVELDGVALPVSGLRRKAVLAVLGLAAGEVVSRDHLLDVVWEGQSSAVGLNALQTHVSYLRRVIGRPDAIVARGGGYLLDLGPDATDLQVAVRLIEQGRQEIDPERRAARLRSALSLWRGRPLGDVTGLAWFDAQAERMAALHLDAMVTLTEARLALGEHSELVPELRELAGQHRYREDVVRQLMLALYRTGRQAEALAVYRDLRQTLADELGLDPGVALRDLEAAMLRQDRALDASAPIRPDTSGGVGEVIGQVPAPPDGLPAGAAHTLPPDAGAFTGRARESSDIITATVGTAGRARMSVHAIDGMPGVGKTALAVHVAHRLAKRLSVRPVFVNLHGHTDGRDPVDPAEVLASLLAADGLDPRVLPEGAEARSALWRQRTAERSVLMVLDNAASSAQVGPLLPGGPECVVLVTSRRFLGDLPVGVMTVSLDVLTPAEAEHMFLRLAPRAAIEPSGVADLVAACGFLPLAIALLARLLARHRTWTVTDLLAEARAKLVTVAAEDRTVEAAFDLSYRHLATDRQRLFRCLGLHPGVEIDPYAAAALAGTHWTETAGHLDALHADNLLVEVGYHRYTMHDLIRHYARRVAAVDPVAEREEARDRLFGYYRYTAAAADAQLTRHTRPTQPADPAPATGAPDVGDPARALAWMRTERDNVLACVAATNDPRHLVALTASAAELLRRDGPWTEAVALHQSAAIAAEQVNDQIGRANALTDLATVHRCCGDYPAGERVGRQALDIYRCLGDRLGEANALTCLGHVFRNDGKYDEAGQALERALAIYGDAGDRRGRATALTSLGSLRYMRDEYTAATQALRDAVHLCRELGDRLGEAHALTHLGEVLRVDGDYLGAVASLHEALTGHRDLGDRLGQALALCFLGNVHILTGNYQDATEPLKESMDLYRDLGDRMGQANALDSLAQASLGIGNPPGAMQAAREALDLYRAIDNRHGQAKALMRQGKIRRATGDYGAARHALQQALEGFRQVGDRGGEAEVLSELGAVARLTGDLVEARRLHTEAVHLAQEINGRWDEAYAWAGIGRCDLAEGDIPAAVEHLTTAWAMFDRIGAAEAAEVAAELDALRTSASPGDGHSA
jgi:DNA-binding SARP family transcriptional activator/tetratricopeptide (TPR) repeat protein